MKIDPQKLFFTEITNLSFYLSIQNFDIFGSIDYIFIFFKPSRGINIEVILVGDQYVLAYSYIS